MEHPLAQKRMLICASFFSFGALSGAMCFFRLSASAAERLYGMITSFFMLRPELTISSGAILAPLLMLLCGFSPAGTLMIELLLVVFGATGGLFAAMLLSFGAYPLLIFAVFLLYALCILIFAAGFRRISCLVCAQLRSGGVLRPDFTFGLARVIVALAVLLFTAFALAYFILSV